jgi:hypothetical protein
MVGIMGGGVGTGVGAGVEPRPVGTAPAIGLAAAGNASPAPTQPIKAIFTRPFMAADCIPIRLTGKDKGRRVA